MLSGRHVSFMLMLGAIPGCGFVGGITETLPEDGEQADVVGTGGRPPEGFGGATGDGDLNDPEGAGGRRMARPTGGASGTDPSSGGGPDGAGGGEQGSGGAETGAGGDGTGGSVVVPPEVSCESTTEVTVGNAQGQYLIQALRVAAMAEGGDYTIALHTGDDGVAYLFRDGVHVAQTLYDPSSSFSGGAVQTIAFDEYLAVDLKSSSAADLSDIGTSLFDGCHVFAVSPISEVGPGTQSHGVVITELTVESDAPLGSYTFVAESGTAGMVSLLLNGNVLQSLSYSWQTTITPTAPYTFKFPGYLSVTVNRVMGSSNLFVMPQVLFDGRHILRVD